MKGIRKTVVQLCLFAVLLVSAIFVCTAVSAKAADGDGPLYFEAGAFRYHAWFDAEEDRYVAYISGTAEHFDNDTLYIPGIAVNGSYAYKVIGIEDGAFLGRTDIKDICYSTRNYMEHIGNYAFAGSGLVKFNSAPTLISIGDSAFDGCLELVSANIGPNVTTIGDAAFAYCPKLTKISVSSSNPYIKVYKKCLYTSDYKRLLDGCCAKGSIKLHKGLESIADYAFENNDKITAVTIPEGCKEIGEFAFINCTSLESVKIPSTVKNINGNPFVYCTKLKSIKVASGNTVYRAKSGMLLSANKKTLVAYPSAKGEITLPTSIRYIGALSFCGDDNLTAINLSKRIKSVGEFAFYDCTQLNRVVIDSLKCNLSADDIFCNSYIYINFVIPYSTSEAEEQLKAVLKAQCPEAIITNR